MEFLTAFELSPTDWFVFILCGFFIGLSKAGLSGAGLLVVPLMATTFSSRASVGILLPMLVFADMYAVKYYNRHAEWKYVLKLIPWTVLGIFIGLKFGKELNDAQFKQVIAILVLVGIALMIWLDRKKDSVSIPDTWWLAAILGLAGGFTTMVGNASGPIMILYLLSMGLPKNKFIGTGAWFFFIVNLIKIPLHIFGWKTITLHSFYLDLLVLPAIISGAFLGVRLVKLFPEKAYRYFILISTIVSAVFLFLK